MTADYSDLLKRYSPVLRFDARELFFPVSVEGFFESSALIKDGIELQPAGSVTEEVLAQHTTPSSHLRFVSEQDRLEVVSEEAKRLARKFLGPRLGRVGLFGRILDALFQLSVLVRPTTPQLTTVASALKAERLGLQKKPVVYGRVVASGDWLVLHYSFFYVMNDWRSGYHGLNDHEGDWEQAWVFCDRSDQKPVWVVASSHEYAGGDLRRHWDDELCHRVDGRPVFYVGAGSHALYHRPGDYVTRIEIPGFRWLLRFQRWTRRMLRIRDEAAERGLGPALGMPFVDAATGDGHSVSDWDLRPLDDVRPCFGTYRGLWGLDTGDPTDGERGPSGPKFTRSGKIRRSWADPLGFADLHGVSPPSSSRPDERLLEIDLAIKDLDRDVRRLKRVAQLSGQAVNPELSRRESTEIGRLLKKRIELADLKDRIVAGKVSHDEHRDHLLRPAVPIPPPKESGWVLALWAAISIPLLLVVVASLFLVGNAQVGLGWSGFGWLEGGGLRFGSLMIAMAATISVLEQLARRHFQAAFRLTLFYGLVGSLVLFVSLVSLSRYVIGATFAVGAVILFIVNVGELSSTQKRAEDASGRDGDSSS